MTISKKKAEEILGRIKDDVEEAKSEVLIRLDRWLERMAFYRGLHYTVNGGEFHLEADDATGEAREVHNYIPSFVKASVATRIRHLPNPSVPAADGNAKSMARAKATERLLKTFVDDDILTGEEFNRALHSAAILGGAWLKPVWNPLSGKPVPTEVEVMEAVIEDEEGNQEIVRIEGEREKDVFGVEITSKDFEGKIEVGFVDLFDGWPDPAASTAAEMRYWVHRKIRPSEELQRLFPEDMFGKPIKWAGTSIDEIWSQKQSVLAYDLEGGTNVVGTEGSHNEMAVVYEYWGAPNQDYPNGVFCLYSNDHILHMSACPYVPARVPAIFLQGDNIVPGGFYPDGVVEHLIQPQKTLNRAETKIRETMDRMLNPHILIPHNSDVDAEIFDEIGGQTIYYNAGFPPHILHAPEIPASMFNVSASMVQRMQEISTYSDVARGQAPTDRASGRLANILQEQENNIRSAEIRLYKQTMLDAMMHCLHLARQHYKDGRMIRTLGSDSWTLTEFNAEEYDWDIDLAPEPFSGSPNSRALRWAETTEAFQMGLFNDEIPGAKTVRRMLEIDHANRSTTDKDQIHRQLALKENNQVVQRSAGEYNGPINPVREFHDNEIHLEEHNAFRNSEDYLDLTPDARAMLDAHCEEHEANLAAQMQDFAGNQQMLNPVGGSAPKELGTASQPTNGSLAGQLLSQ